MYERPRKKPRLSRGTYFVLAIASVFVFGNISYLFYKLAKKEPEVVHVVPSPTPAPRPIPVYTPTPKPTPEPTSELTPEPTPESTPKPTPTPLKPSSVKRVGEDEWRVYLTNKHEWFDTQIPIIAGQNFSYDFNSKGEFLVKLNNHVFFNKDFYVLEFRENADGYERVDYDFRDTIKLRINEDVSADEIWLVVKVTSYMWGTHAMNVFCPFYGDTPKHHEPAIRWAKAMRAKLSRP